MSTINYAIVVSIFDNDDTGTADMHRCRSLDHMLEVANDNKNKMLSEGWAEIESEDSGISLAHLSRNLTASIKSAIA